jgi:hypothetical protein
VAEPIIADATDTASALVGAATDAEDGKIVKYSLDYLASELAYSGTCLTKWRTWTGCSRHSPTLAGG